VAKTIVCTTTFLDGRDRFEKGETRVVDDGRADYFIANGWASAPGAESNANTASGVQTLDIHNAVMGQEARHG
jgi:hypothetical protein